MQSKLQETFPEDKEEISINYTKGLLKKLNLTFKKDKPYLK